MMIEFVFTPDDAARVRFAFSPVWEAVGALRVLADPSRRALHLPWLRAVQPRLEGLDLRLLRVLVPATGYVADFLTPPPSTPLPDFAAELETILATPREVVVEELLWSGSRGTPLLPQGRREPAPPVQRGLSADPEATLETVAEQMDLFHRVAIQPFWGRIQELLEGDVLRRSRALTEHGAAGVFVGLHETVTWDNGVLRIGRPWDFHGGLDGKGLLLVPSVFTWPRVQVVAPPYQAMLSYPVSGVATVWETRPARRSGALGALVGRVRAEVLHALDAPSSTTELARRLGVTPGAVSQHLAVLRSCDLVTGHRMGRRVVYVRTPAGDTLARIH
ncbi:ArsR/SmtB family transcription factor [Actinomadura rupiterrae]|uniref:ArsR/SmtB family transcription factor n=1 Tax=Actinomadura rupiterrae TaxID=559627 RepID=UPI0020A61404|nr:winged helix-turn-helix domain-containing protein [Actinomadura rupiterrae]MCP2338555.1 DNA-binding transcriptional ArsR family regulator [Actinomadura rupiterrae]